MMRRYNSQSKNRKFVVEYNYLYTMMISNTRPKRTSLVTSNCNMKPSIILTSGLSVTNSDFIINNPTSSFEDSYNPASISLS